MPNLAFHKTCVFKFFKVQVEKRARNTYRPGKLGNITFTVRQHCHYCEAVLVAKCVKCLRQGFFIHLFTIY